MKDVAESEHDQDTESRNKSTAAIDSSLRDKDIVHSITSGTDLSDHPQKPHSLPSKLVKNDTVVNSNDSMEVEFDSNDLDNAKHTLDMEESDEIDYLANDNDDTTETTGTDNEDEENINNA